MTAAAKQRGVFPADYIAPNAAACVSEAGTDPIRRCPQYNEVRGAGNANHLSKILRSAVNATAFVRTKHQLWIGRRNNKGLLANLGSVETPTLHSRPLTALPLTALPLTALPLTALS